METRFPLENGHLLCTQMGERVRLYMEVRTTATGLCRGLLLGENGNLDLGPMLPEGGCLRLERSFLVETLQKKGCFQLAWPWDPEAPFPLPPVFCFARVQSLGDRPYLVFQFQPGGIPRIEE